MKDYIIKYKLAILGKDRIVSITTSFSSDMQALKSAHTINRSNYVQEVYNKTDDVTIYHHKKANLADALSQFDKQLNKEVDI